MGIIDYQVAWDFQTAVHQKLISEKRDNPHGNRSPHTLILCEHPHVYTLGKSGTEQHLMADQSMLHQIEARFYKINRGGDITYHGPGQLVAYPILDLDRVFTDVHRYVRSLEEVIIRLLEDYGIKGGREPQYTGVWLDEGTSKARKICAIGVHLSRWVSLHGLALNVNTNLDYFNHIIPCGIQDPGKTVCSIQSEIGRSVEMDEIKERFIRYFLEIFEMSVLES